MNIKKIIKEEIESDDFDWARGDIYFSIDYILGKQLYYRYSNINELEQKYGVAVIGFDIEKIPKNEIVLGDIKWSSMFKVNSINGNTANIHLNRDDYDEAIQYTVNEVEFYVNVGIYALENEYGDIVNDFSGKYLKESEELDWIKQSKPNRKDKINYNKERYQTTIDYDNIKIGDKFIPPGSHIIWTVEDIDNWKMVWGNDEHGKPKLIKYFIVWIRNNKGELKRKNYNNKVNAQFPGSYKPWKKIINLNESEDFGWAEEIKPEMTAEAVPLYYNKPLYWYHEGKPLSQWGMPTIYWISKSYVSQRGENISLLCYKDIKQLKEKIECSAHYDYTLSDKINRGELVFQPQLNDIEPT